MSGRTEELKSDIVKGIFWKALENGGDQLITFLISLVLARLLGPEKYGTMALMLIFVSIANVMIQSGFQTALIQKRKVDIGDYSSVLYLGLIMALVIYLLIFFAAPFLGDYFADSELTPMLRVLSLMLFSGAVISVEIAYIARNMDFKKQCVATVEADILSGVAGIAAAFYGLGTWALVIQQLMKNLLLMLILIVSLGIRPAPVFSLKKLSKLFSYGWKVLVSGLIDTVYNNIYTPVISKLYSPVTTGLYSRGNQFPQIIANAMAQTMQSVMLPAFSKNQDSKEELKEMLRRTVKMGSFVMFPMMAGLMAVAEPLIEVLLGEAWSDCTPYLVLCALGYSVWPMHVANLQAVNAQGRSDIYLKLEIIKKLMGLAVLFLSLPYGILTMILLKSCFDFVCTFINAAPNSRLIGYGPLKQWRDVLPEFGISVFMGITVWLSCKFLAAGFFMSGLGGFISLVLLVAEGIILFIVAAALFKLESLKYIMETIKGYKKAE